MAKKNKKQLEDELNRYGREYEIAKRKGDQQGMAAAHAKANQTRKEAGWTYDKKRGYTVDGARIVNSKENLTFAKTKTKNTVEAIKQVEQSKPLTKRFTPSVSQSKPKPKPQEKKSQSYRTTPQIQTSNAFTPPPSALSAPQTPKRNLTSSAFTPPQLSPTLQTPAITSNAFPAPLSVWQQAEQERKRTKDAEQATRERALEKLKWQYQQQENFKPFGTVPQAAAYGLERGAAGIAGGIENILSGVSELKNNTMHKLTSVFGDNFISDEYKRRAELAQKVRGVDVWRQSIEDRYHPTEGMRKAGDLGETIGNMVPSILADAALNMYTGGAPAIAKGVTALAHAAKESPRIGMALMALNSYGAGAHRAKMEGADTDTASLYGALSATGETLSENMFGAIPGLDRTGVLSKAVNQLVKNPILAKGIDIAGEGAEEAVMAVADPYLQRLTYNPDAKQASPEEIKEQALMGMLSAGILQGGAAIGNRMGRYSERNHQYSAPRNQQIPDFEAQWNRYNQMGQAGLPFEQVIPYETDTPVDYETAYSAHASGYNDFIERTKQTATRILSGNEADLTEIADAVVSPPARQMLEQGLKLTLSQNAPQAVRQVREAARITSNPANSQALGVSENGQKNNVSGETQYKIKTLPDGRRYVKADREVITGDDPKAWSKQAERFINDVIRNGEDITVFTQDGFEVQITDRSAYKLSDPHVQRVQKIGRALLPDAALGAKMRAAGHIDELLEISRTNGYLPDKNGNHANDIGEKGFDYFSAYFEDADGQFYQVKMSAGVNEGAGIALNDDIDTAYSIGEMQKRSPMHRRGSSNSPFVSGAQSGVQRTSSDSSIVQNQSAGNPQAQTVTQMQQTPATARQTGVIQNRAAHTVDKRTVDTLDRIAKRTGFSVEFVQGVQEAGSHQDGKIRINTESGDPVRQIFVHELTHHLEQSGEYNTLSQSILEEINKDGALSDVQQYIWEKYRANGIELDDDGVRREIVAEFAEENLFTDERAIEQLAKKNRSLFQKIRDWLHDMRIKLRGTAEEKFILQAEKMYTKALDSLEGAKPQTLGVSENGQKNNASGETQYSFSKQKIPSYEELIAKPDIPVVDIRGRGEGRIAEQRKQFLNSPEAHKLYEAPVINRDTGEPVFITSRALEHTFSNRGLNQINVGKHLKEIIEHAVLTHAEEATHGADNVSGVYTLFGAVQTEQGIQPVKLKVKEYIDDGRSLPQFIKQYFEKNGKQNPYASAYDGRVLELESIEKEEASSSVLTGTEINSVQGRYPSASSSIRVADLYDLVNSEYQKYLPKKITEALVNTPLTNNLSAGGTMRSRASAGNSVAQNQNGSNTQTQTVTQVKQNKISGASSINEIIQQNREQGKTINALRAQLQQQSDGVVTDPKEVKQLVRGLLNDYSSRVDRGEMTARIQEIYDDIANNTADNGDIQTRIRQAARDILEHSAVLNTETEADYNGIRKYLKDNKLTLSEQDKADITDYNDFRKSLFGTIKLGNEGIPVDTAYAEMTEMFGEGLFPSDITHPAEQLTHIADTVRALKPVLENPHTREMDAATRVLSDEIYERFFDLGEHPTRGRRQQRQIDAIRAQANERLTRALQQERQKRDKAIDKLKARHSEMTWERRQRTTQNELRRKITQHAGKLSTMLLKPTDTRHIVENGRQTENGQTISMKKTVAALLETINLESQYSIDPETGKRIYTGETEGQLTKRTEKFRELRAMYEAVEHSTDSTMVVDPDLLYNLAELENMKDVKLSDYTTEQLYTLWNTIRAVESSLTSENKLFSQMRYQDIKSVGERLIADNHTDKPRDSGRGTDTRGVKKAMQDAEDFLEVEMLTPYHYFRQLGDSGRAIFSELSRARGKYIADTDWTLKYLEEMKGDIDTSTWSGKKAELIPFETTGGQHGKMTRAQRISLYLLAKRKQGLKHLTDKNGGIMMHEKGTETAERIVLTKGDIERICADMSLDERKIAKGLSVAMEHFAKLGNESSMKLYGYEKFGEKNYFPIRTERNYRNTEKENAAPGEKGYRIKNAGMTKSTDPGATNPIVLENAFDVFGRHASEMAKYHAFAPVLTDIDRIYNYQQWNEGERGQSVKVMLENKLGKAGIQYWEQLVNDVNSGIQRERTPFSGMFSNFKAAKVGANLRVVFQQPLSYIRAGHMIDAKYLMEGLSGKTDTEIMEKYAPIARWKALGYSEMDTGRQLSDMLSGKKETFLEKVRAASMWMPGKADEVTWKALWRAVEAETQDRTSLTPGTEAYYEAVGERFTEIIDRTQVVDTVLNRSGAMRNGGYGHQLGTMFMAEPTLDYNEIMANAKDVKAGKSGAVHQAVRCAGYMTVGAITKAFVCSLVDAGRDKDEDETWTQKFVQAFWGADGTEESMGEYISHVMSGNLVEGFNPMTWTPFLKDLVSLAQGYDRKSPDTALVSDFLKSVQRLKDAANGEGKTALPAAIVQLLAKTADLSGLPLSNLEREIESAVNSVLLMPVVKNSAAGQQAKFTFRRFHTRLGSDNIRDWVKWGNKNLTDEGVLHSFKDFLERNELATEQDFRDAQTGNKSKALSDLVSAWKDETRNGNTQAAEEIVRQMDSLGYSDKKVQGRLSVAEQALLKETWDFKQKKSDHNVRITDRAAKSRQWKQLSAEQQEFFEARTAQYAGVLALSEVDKSQKLEEMSTKWYAKARDAKTVKLSEEQFLVMWTVTKDIESMKDKDGKTIPNSRGLRIMQEIYKTFPGLSEEQYIYLFDARNVPQKAMYTGDSKKHINNPARTAQELEKMRKKAKEGR